MPEDRLLCVFDVSELVKEMKTMISDLTTMSENNKEESANIMKIIKKV